MQHVAGTEIFRKNGDKPSVAGTCPRVCAGLYTNQRSASVVFCPQLAGYIEELTGTFSDMRGAERTESFIGSAEDQAKPLHHPKFPRGKSQTASGACVKEDTSYIYKGVLKKSLNSRTRLICHFHASSY